MHSDHFISQPNSDYHKPSCSKEATWIPRESSTEFSIFSCAWANTKVTLNPIYCYKNPNHFYILTAGQPVDECKAKRCSRCNRLRLVSFVPTWPRISMGPIIFPTHCRQQWRPGNGQSQCSDEQDQSVWLISARCWLVLCCVDAKYTMVYKKTNIVCTWFDTSWQCNHHCHG